MLQNIMLPKPKMVSIIIPTFNSSLTLNETLESVEIQNEEIEILIVDNNSTDETLSIAENYKLKSKHKIEVFPGKHINASTSRNFGLTQATGSFVLFLDSDDLLKPDAITVLLRHSKNNDIVFGGWEDFDSSTRKVSAVVDYEGYLNEKRFTPYFKFKPTISTALINTNALVKWDENMLIWEVTQFFFDILLNGAKAKYIPDIVTSVRQHNSIERLSIKHNHFDPLKTIDFLIKSKFKLSEFEELDVATEIVIDQQIVSYSYEELKINRATEKLAQYFSTVNLSLMGKYYKGKIFGIYFFILAFKGFNGLKCFYFINKFLNRV